MRNRSKLATTRSRSMRQSLTAGEASLWSELKQFKRIYGVHVRRQVPIGPYFADFAILSHRMIIELDGETQHSANGMKKDAIRDAYLNKLGYRVHRITTGEWADNRDGCIETLLHDLDLL